jgi:3-hydroxyisobutyrate dehydrogenase-like beta-hydroxyacid dehydrogenase
MAKTAKPESMPVSRGAESTPADVLDQRAARLVESLLEDGGLEPVNARARFSLTSKLADLLQHLPDAPDAEAAMKAAEAVLELLVDAPEVAEVFADEAHVAALLKAFWAPAC